LFILHGVASKGDHSLAKMLPSILTIVINLAVLIWTIKDYPTAK